MNFEGRGFFRGDRTPSLTARVDTSTPCAFYFAIMRIRTATVLPVSASALLARLLLRRQAH